MPTDDSLAVDRQLGKLVDHLAWADQRVADSLRAMPHPDARALELYAHVVGAEHTWIARLLERAPQVTVWPQLTIAEATALGVENASALRMLLESLSPEQLQRKVAYTNSAGLAFESSVEDMLLQVVLHGCYHRGQIALLVRGADGVPSPTDYIAFVRGVPAAVTVRPGR